MSLLFDQNLSRRLPALLSHEYPGSEHVILSGLAGADDITIWNYAAAKGLTIISKHSDFKDLALKHGPPPKAIRLRIGNCRTKDIVALFHAEAATIASLMADPNAALLEIS